MDEETLNRMIHVAREARLRSHAPYSHFAVGAALLDDAGHIHAGANIENAAYPEGLCAEASALAHLVMAGGRRVMAAVVVGEGAQPVTPCGGCRQKLREFGRDDMPVIVADLRERRLQTTLGQLLPQSFGPDHLHPSQRQR